ncbi:DUF6042 family protein [Streptomyces sp. NPDC006367]|uniref:DUF6042 family protein n=1 Tax=unclassified Streptomyces TaxID=2593676 RepID=UPI0033A9CE39
MTENPSVPGPRRDMVMRNDRWDSGWNHVLPRQGFPPTMRISPLDRLAAATGQNTDDVRVTLTELVKSGDAQARHGQEPADTVRLATHRRLRPVMNWDHFHENRTEPSAGPTAHD